MSDTRELQVSAERCARALTAGYLASPRLDPLVLLGQHLGEVELGDRADWLGLVAIANAATTAGVLAGLSLHGLDAGAILTATALARENQLQADDDDDDD